MANLRDRLDEVEKELEAMKAKVESAYTAAIAAKSPPVPSTEEPATPPADSTTEAETPA